MAGLKAIFASLASVGIVAAALVAGVAYAPRMGDPLAASAEEDGFLGATPVAFDDPEGDASDVGMGDVGTLAGCYVGYVLEGECGERIALPNALPAPHVDITRVAFVEETESEVVFSLTVARLEEGFPEARSNDAQHRMLQYGVCWYTEDGCTRAMYVNAMRHGDVGHATTRFEAYTEDCNEWQWCSWDIPTEIVYGAPAELVFRVPKALAAYGGPLEVHHLDAYSAWYDQPTAFPMWHGGATLHTPARHVHDHSASVGTFGIADVTPELPAELTFTPLTDATYASALDAPLALGHAGMTHADESTYDKPELDLAGLDLYQDGADLVVVLALAQADAQPTYDFDYSVSLAFDGGDVMEIGFRQSRGDAIGYAGLCIMEECQESRTHEIPAEFVAGAPAFVILRVPADVLDDLVDLKDGDATTLIWTSAMYTEGSQYFGGHDAAVYGDIHHAFMVDELMPAASFVWGSGHRAPLEAFGATSEHAH